MKLKEALEKKKFVVTSEVQVPMGDDLCDCVHIITLGGIDKIQPYLDAAKIAGSLFLTLSLCKYHPEDIP